MLTLNVNVSEMRTVPARLLIMLLRLRGTTLNANSSISSVTRWASKTVNWRKVSSPCLLVAAVISSIVVTYIQGLPEVMGRLWLLGNHLRVVINIDRFWLEESSKGQCKKRLSTKIIFLNIFYFFTNKSRFLGSCNIQILMCMLSENHPSIKNMFFSPETELAQSLPVEPSFFQFISSAERNLPFFWSATSFSIHLLENGKEERTKHVRYSSSWT